MKTVLINASPKAGESTSRYLLETVRAMLNAPAEQIELHKEHVLPEDIGKLAAADQWVFFAPLYVDALPSHLLPASLNSPRRLKNWRRLPCSG